MFLIFYFIFLYSKTIKNVAWLLPEFNFYLIICIAIKQLHIQSLLRDLRWTHCWCSWFLLICPIFVMCLLSSMTIQSSNVLYYHKTHSTYNNTTINLFLFVFFSIDQYSVSRDILQPSSTEYSNIFTLKATTQLWTLVELSHVRHKEQTVCSPSMCTDYGHLIVTYK